MFFLIAFAISNENCRGNNSSLRREIPNFISIFEVHLFPSSEGFHIFNKHVASETSRRNEKVSRVGDACSMMRGHDEVDCETDLLTNYQVTKWVGKFIYLFLFCL